MNEPLLDEIRRVRKIISAEIGSDLEGLVARDVKMETQFAKPPITIISQPDSGSPSAAR
jgi:hypothetical protein